MAPDSKMSQHRKMNPLSPEERPSSLGQEFIDGFLYSKLNVYCSQRYRPAHSQFYSATLCSLADSLLEVGNVWLADKMPVERWTPNQSSGFMPFQLLRRLRRLVGAGSAMLTHDEPIEASAWWNLERRTPSLLHKRNSSPTASIV